MLATNIIPPNPALPIIAFIQWAIPGFALNSILDNISQPIISMDCDRVQAVLNCSETLHMFLRDLEPAPYDD